MLAPSLPTIVFFYFNHKAIKNQALRFKDFMARTEKAVYIFEQILLQNRTCGYGLWAYLAVILKTRWPMSQLTAYRGLHFITSQKAKVWRSV